jgi:23S rRNA pseudouridine1911/1915/1917 synthase
MMAAHAPERLDQCLVRLGLVRSRRTAREFIAEGRVRVNGRQLPKGASVTSGDRVEVIDPAPPVEILPNSASAIPILYADAAMLIVNKPGLMPCHPLRRDERDTVMNAIVVRYPETAFDMGKSLEGGLVHRLDNGTSGALMIARTAAALGVLRAALRSGAVRREYYALVAGRLAAPIEITTPVAHHPKNPRKMIAIAEYAITGYDGPRRGRTAATSVIPLRQQNNFTLVKVLPRNGSRHQIRVHLASSGYPLVGDELYGGPAIAELPPGRFWLHLTALELDSPAGRHVQLQAPLPHDLMGVLVACNS